MADASLVDVPLRQVWNDGTRIRGVGKLRFAGTAISSCDIDPSDNSMVLVQIDTSPGGGAVGTARTLTAGAGLVGGGDLSANRTFDVGANADGSITVNANDIQVGILATDAQHGVRGGGTLHAAVVSGGASGFMTGTQAATLAAVSSTYVPLTLTLTAGAGLTGGGDLSANRTFDVVANADGSMVINANDIQVGILATDAQHGNRGGGAVHALVVSGGAAGFISGANQAKLDGVGAGAAIVTVTAGAGLLNSGTATNPLIDVVAADTSIVVTADAIQVGATLPTATTFSAAGTALTVTNNATVSGTLTVTTINAPAATRLTLGSYAVSGWTCSNANLSFTTLTSGNVTLLSAGDVIANASGAVTNTSRAASTWTHSGGAWALTATSSAVTISTVTAGAIALTSAAGLNFTSTTGDWQASANVTIDSSGGTIGIGTDGDAFAINIGSTNTGTRVITMGNTHNSSSVALVAGNNGSITIGTGALSVLPITIGNSSNGSNLTIDGGANCTMSFGATANSHTTTIGSSTSLSPTTVQSGSTGLTLGSTGGISLLSQAATTWTHSGGAWALTSTASSVTISTVTSGTIAITSAGAFNSTSAAASTWTHSGGAWALNSTSQSVTISTLTSGTLALVSAGALNFTGVAASTWSLSGGAFILQATSQAMTLRTVTSGTLAVTSAGALNLTGVAASTWSLSGGAFILQATSQAMTLRTVTSGTLAVTSAGACTVDGTTITVGASTATTVGIGRSGQSVGFFGATAAVRQTSGANLTNNVTAGGVNDTVNDVTIGPALLMNAADGATTQSAVYQLARKLKQINDGLRTLGIFT